MIFHSRTTENRVTSKFDGGILTDTGHDEVATPTSIAEGRERGCSGLTSGNRLVLIKRCSAVIFFFGGKRWMAIDTDKLNQLLGRFVDDFGAAFHAGMAVIGDKLGLYKGLAEAGPSTSTELAERTHTTER